jgi:hypothetical protein
MPIDQSSVYLLHGGPTDIRLCDEHGYVVYGSEEFVHAGRVHDFAAELQGEAVRQGLDVARQDTQLGLYVIARAIPRESQAAFIAAMNFELVINLTVHGTPHNGRDGKGPAPEHVTGTLDDKAIALYSLMQLMNETNHPSCPRVGQDAQATYA